MYVTRIAPALCEDSRNISPRISSYFILTSHSHPLLPPGPKTLSKLRCSNARAYMLAKLSQLHGSARFLHTSRTNLVLQQKQLTPISTATRTSSPSRRKPAIESTPDTSVHLPKAKPRHGKHPAKECGSMSAQRLSAKRNEVGVQLLSRRLHEQIFRNVSFPPPNPASVRIAREHLGMHGLDPSQGSVLPDLEFTLPPLQGRTLDEHFYKIGSVAAQPWLSLAKDLASAELPPRPDEWLIEAGWTKYVHHPDGSSYWEHVPYPEHDGKAEDMLVFDVETMPEYSPYAIMACAASKNAWYVWISPWLLGETSEMQHLIPLGDPSASRVVVGHNVSYDRARIKEEYSVGGTGTRFLDTMALHVAVKGISSHQRPAWMKYRKEKETAKARKDEAVDAVLKLMQETEKQQQEEQDAAKKEELRQMRQAMEESLPQLQEGIEGDAELTSKRWEDITSANSLADVAKLHCNIDIDKAIRDDFGSRKREDIFEGIHDYLNYCSSDVVVTHAVFCKVLPSFLESCPSPVSFAGILTMGSALLTVNHEWERYIENAERTYRELDEKVKVRLVELAHQAKEMMADESWKKDVWLSQLDWTPKVAGKSRGVFPEEVSPTFPWTPSCLIHYHLACANYRRKTCAKLGTTSSANDAASAEMVPEVSLSRTPQPDNRQQHAPLLVEAPVRRLSTGLHFSRQVALPSGRRSQPVSDRNQVEGLESVEHHTRYPRPRERTNDVLG